MARTTQTKKKDAENTVTIGGRVLRARKPEEWSIADNERVLRHSIGISRRLAGTSKLPDEERGAVVLGIAEELLEKDDGSFKLFLSMGLWPDGVPYSEEAAREHEEFVTSTHVGSKQAVTGLSLAIQSFMQS